MKLSTYIFVFGTLLFNNLVDSSEQNNWAISNSLKVVGEIDGKTFYTDGDPTVEFNGVGLDVALQFCRDNWLFPARVTSIEQIRLIESALGNFRPFWLHIHDNVMEGDFHWVRGNEAVTFSDWRQGDPISDPIGGPQNNCAYIYRGSNGTWTNLPCYTSWRPLCEYP